MRTITKQVAYTACIVAITISNSFAQNVDVWIGTGGKDGIFHLTLDTKDGKMSKPQLFAKIDGSGFLAKHPKHDVLYSTMKKDGDAGVASFNISETRKRNAASGPASAVNFVSSGDGGSACVGTDRTGNTLFSAQYGGGSTTSYSLADDGTIEDRVGLVEHGPGSSVNEKRQAKSHPHWVGTSPDNRFLMVPDLGKDAVVVYTLDAQTAEIKKHSEAAVPPGAGPRHMKFHQNKKHAYVLNELALTISVFEYEAETAGFKSIQVIETLPDDQKDKHLNSAAEIRIHPNGKFVYSSNRGHDSISVFSIDKSTGKLTFVEREHIRGSWPRNFNIDPTGKWLIAAGQYSNTLSLFEIDQKSGELVFTRKCVNVPKPICVFV